MTDRELLELAAKTVGYWDKEFNCYNGSMSFDPLTNDGDALRLAINLGLSVKFGECVEGAPIVIVSWGDVRIECSNYPDPYAATRRAIVRAAAEIGKGLT